MSRLTTKPGTTKLGTPKLGTTKLGTPKLAMLRLAVLAGLGVAGLVVAGAGAVLAQPVADLIKTREGAMETLEGVVKDMKKAAEANQDLAPFEPRVLSVIERLKPFKSYFPAGSGPESGVKTCALPGLWTNPEQFDKGHSNLMAQLEKLSASLRGSDKDDMKAQYVATGRTCSAGCHGRAVAIAKWPPCG
jgi:cytochrome c556